ncbi:MAG: barstar family protein [Marinobacter sp.]|uniref:barstar family protein n=1 Tax=Marinobacter sp. TaxID=50741 RepID=UPI0029C11FCE|nr:barstar family protein [Marinobacter sp.]MDX5386420.1 barstar family protein [Marinobacter sp.]
MRVVMNGREILSEADFHNKISEAMNFPSYYGKNLDALWDVLSTDIERPVTLVWENADSSKESMGNSFAKIVDLLNRVMAQDEEWGLDERFEVVIS